MESYEETLRRERVGNLLEMLEDQVEIQWVPLIHAAMKTYVYLHSVQAQGQRVCLVDADGKITSDVPIPSDAGLINRFLG